MVKYWRKNIKNKNKKKQTKKQAKNCNSASTILQMAVPVPSVEEVRRAVLQLFQQYLN